MEDPFPPVALVALAFPFAGVLSRLVFEVLDTAGALSTDFRLGGILMSAALLEAQ